MSTTAPQIVTHDELSFEPECIVPADSIRRATGEEERRGRDVNVWAVTPSQGGEPYLVTYHLKTCRYYCTCPAGMHGNICKHLRSVAWQRAYQAAYRMYACLTLQELREREFDFIEMERGALVQVRCWRAINSAIGELVRQRTDEAA